MYRTSAIVKSSPVIILFIWILSGALWVQFSDQLILKYFHDSANLAKIQSIDSWFFILANGILIFSFVRKNNSILGSAIEELEISSNKFRNTYEFAPVGIAHHKPNEKWILVNKMLCDMLGYTRQELLDLNFEDFIHPQDLSKSRELDQKLVKKLIPSYNMEMRFIRKDRTSFLGLISKSSFYNAIDDIVYLVLVIEDITQRKEAEKALKNSIEEKTVLLSEIHHRVKNNLALISALFDLQTMHIDNEEAQEILKDSRMRVKCLALVHESFSDTEKMSHTNLGIYLSHLVDFVSRTFNKDDTKREIIINKDLPNVEININQAIPAGLICNELLLKSYLNLPIDAENPVINISLKHDEEKVILTISTTEIQEHSERYAGNSSSLSMLIVKTLCDQLNGKLTNTVEENSVFFELEFIKRDVKGPGSTL